MEEARKPETVRSESDSKAYHNIATVVEKLAEETAIAHAVISDGTKLQKRPRGRPRKRSLDLSDTEPKPKRPRGRPRIHPLPDPDSVKRPRGRPRKIPPPLVLGKESNFAPQTLVQGAIKRKREKPVKKPTPLTPPFHVAPIQPLPNEAGVVQLEDRPLDIKIMDQQVALRELVQMKQTLDVVAECISRPSVVKIGGRELEHRDPVPDKSEENQKTILQQPASQEVGLNVHILQVKKGRGRPRKVRPATLSITSTGEQPVKRKRGRPKKVRPEDANGSTTSTGEQPVKRKRGRPKKIRPEDANGSTTSTGEQPVKRKRGRPKKIRPEDANAAKPLEHDGMTASLSTTSIGEQPLKRKRGRPKKVRPESTIASQNGMAVSATGEQPVKRKKGRPKKIRPEDTSVTKLLEQNETLVLQGNTVSVKRGRGRPRKTPLPVQLQEGDPPVERGGERPRTNPLPLLVEASQPAVGAPPPPSLSVAERLARRLPPELFQHPPPELSVITVAKPPVKRGRPRKHPKPMPSVPTTASVIKAEPVTSLQTKRGRGRPRKHPLPLAAAKPQKKRPKLTSEEEVDKSEDTQEDFRLRVSVSFSESSDASDAAEREALSALADRVGRDSPLLGDHEVFQESYDEESSSCGSGQAVAHTS